MTSDRDKKKPIDWDNPNYWKNLQTQRAADKKAELVRKKDRFTELSMAGAYGIGVGSSLCFASLMLAGFSVFVRENFLIYCILLCVLCTLIFASKDGDETAFSRFMSLVKPSLYYPTYAYLFLGGALWIMGGMFAWIGVPNNWSIFSGWDYLYGATVFPIFCLLILIVVGVPMILFEAVRYIFFREEVELWDGGLKGFKEVDHFGYLGNETVRAWIIAITVLAMNLNRIIWYGAANGFFDFGTYMS